MKKLSNTGTGLKKALAYKKRVFQRSLQSEGIRGYFLEETKFNFFYNSWNYLIFA